MQLLKHVANVMQRAEGFVLERALVVHCYLATDGKGKVKRDLLGRSVSIRLASLLPLIGTAFATTH